ncbi:adenylate/guanylate cyclase domain-containing protein [Magnetospirillum sulfuroxidans]|uniref:Adenylate/guanylate cyclase domain-containing protein n=1 Tax=Magnetospirillum sulfuroxidans TaxID=611300 RepID=A0ABS5IBN4_9PROT|nr:adenylate/guanylate cyclase domain-containing protein [Magnetospirillum sulfuroxidans]MBR9971562.1 adenylate/guanylate cyclase domain-containing protein [Magnetospirillum sulfuroxidans]
MIIVHYEVYVLEGRGWMLHARFPRMERESALAEAKELEYALKIKVRVVRETYYTDNNAFEEAEIYVTGGKNPERASPAPATPSARAGGAGGGRKVASAARSTPAAAARRMPAARPKSKASDEEIAQARQLLGRLLAIVALGLAAALLAIKLTPNVILMLWKMGFGIKVDANSYSQLLMIIFALTFLMTSVPLALKFLPRKTALPKFRAPHLALAGAAAAAPSKSGLSKEMKKSLNKLAKEAQQEAPKSSAADDDDLPPLDLDLADDPSPDEVMAAAASQEQAQEQQPPDKPTAESKGDEPAVPSQSVESQMPKVSRFLDGALEQCRQERIGMDNYNKFALHLYMAGAVEALAEFRKLGAAAKVPLMSEALDVLGTRGEMARSFFDKLPEYRREARYMSVIEAGRNAMGNYLLGDEMGAHISLRDVFRDWNRKTDQTQGQMMTVLFTDMVDSTNMTQIRGDAAAQEIVRRHNLIVRNALSKFGGHEVKHTGDGIMASFLSAGAAVDAMIVVQRQVAEHNTRMPTQTLHLRIGLNAGEPIQEEDDLFGSTVQLAARVCAATNSDEILCTASVMELAGKPSSLFRSVGAKAVKGFRDPITMYEISWK